MNLAGREDRRRLGNGRPVPLMGAPHLELPQRRANLRIEGVEIPLVRAAFCHLLKRAMDARMSVLHGIICEVVVEIGRAAAAAIPSLVTLANAIPASS